MATPFEKGDVEPVPAITIGVDREAARHLKTLSTPQSNKTKE